MSQLDIDGIEADRKALDILAALRDLEGEANSRELRDFLEDMDRSPFHYRVDKYLEPQELVVTHLPDSEPGEFPAKVLKLTQRGSEYLQAVDHDGGVDSDMTRRVERLEERIDSLEEKNRQLEEQNEELQRALDQSSMGDFGAELDSIRSDINGLSTQIDDVKQHPVIKADNSASAVNLGIILGNTATKLLEDVVGENEVDEMEDEVEASLREQGSLL